MGRPLSGKSAPKGRPSLIERFGGKVEEPKPAVKKEAVNKAPAAKRVMSKPSPKKAPAPVAGTASGAEARKQAFAANEAKMKAVRAKLASKNK